MIVKRSKKDNIKLTVRIFIFILLFSTNVILYVECDKYKEEVKDQTIINEEYMKDYQRIILGWNKSLVNYNADIVFFGDSLTYRGNWNENFSKYSICNLAVESDTMEKLYNRIMLVDTLKPKKIFIMIGINDISNGDDLEDIKMNYENLLKYFKEGGYKEVYVQSILPTRKPCKIDNDNIKFVNVEIEKISLKYNYVFINLYDVFTDKDGEMKETLCDQDGIHLNEYGYQVWKESIKDYIKS